MKRLASLLKRGVLNALSAFAVLNATVLVNISASASVRMYALRSPDAKRDSAAKPVRPPCGAQRDIPDTGDGALRHGSDTFPLWGV